MLDYLFEKFTRKLKQDLEKVGLENLVLYIPVGAITAYQDESNDLPTTKAGRRAARRAKLIEVKEINPNLFPEIRYLNGIPRYVVLASGYLAHSTVTIFEFNNNIKGVIYHIESNEQIFAGSDWGYQHEMALDILNTCGVFYDGVGTYFSSFLITKAILSGTFLFL